jgi:hypothetical protein
MLLQLAEQLGMTSDNSVERPESRAAAFRSCCLYSVRVLAFNTIKHRNRM